MHRVEIKQNPLDYYYYFFAKYEFLLNRNSNTIEISKPNLFKRAWEIFRKIQNRGARQRNQLSKRMCYHVNKGTSLMA